MSIQVGDEEQNDSPTPRPLWRNSLSANNLSSISPIISETDESITIRQPVHYPSISRNTQDHDTTATLHRYRYYTRLDPQSNSSMMMPNHVVPSIYYLVIPVQLEGNQNSIVTVFSIWNTMVGTSVLSMPWAIEQAGFGCGIGILISLALLTLYTAYRVLKSPGGLESPENVYEFTDVCEMYMGRCGKYISIVFSLLALLGAAVVYWVLMSNFLFNVVKFIHEKGNGEFNHTYPLPLDNFTDAYCPHPPKTPAIWTTSSTADYFIPLNLPHQDDDPYSLNQKVISHESRHLQHLNGILQEISIVSNNTSHKSLFEKIWSQTKTVPFFLIIFIAPLINFKSPTFFTKFNSLGTVSILYILTFIAVKAAKWGININFEPGHISSIPQFQWSFPALTGTLSLAFFIHNCVLSIMRNQRNPDNNGRDLSLAFFLVAFTYIFIGILFYISYPLDKRCIEDNLLNNFQSSDVMAFVARLFLLFQMITVFPLLIYILRAQLLNTFFGSLYPSLKHVIGVNVVVIGFCLIFATLLPQIGVIIRFSGALCGLAFVFALPCLVYLCEKKRSRTLTWPVALVHGFIIFLGFANFVAQFYTFMV